MYYRVTKETKKKIHRKKCKWTTEPWTQTPPFYPLPTNNQATGTTVRRSWVRPEMQLSVLPEGRPPGPQQARNRSEKKQKSRAKSVGGGTRGRGKVCLFHEEEEQQWRTMHAFLDRNPEENEVNVLNGLKSTLSFRTVRKLVVTVNEIYKCI